MSTTKLIEPVEMSVVVPLSAERSFRLFTTELSKWWPLSTHSLGQERAVSCAAEPRVGGALFEIQEDGTRVDWGRVLVWEPPDRVVYSWHPGHQPSEAQQVELRFNPEGEATRVDLRHYGWEALGEKAVSVRDNYANGWKKVLGEDFVGGAQREAES